MAVKFKLNLTPKQMQIAVGGVIGLAVFGFLYFRYFWQPISERIEKARADIETVQGKIEKAKTQAARLPQIQRELVVLNEQAADAERRLPKSQDLPAVIDTVAKLARKYKVELQTFTPGSPASKQFFVEIPYTMAVKGAFHDVGRFFAAVAMEERIFNVRNVTYAGGGTAATDNKLSIGFQLVAYMYKG